MLKIENALSAVEIRKRLMEIANKTVLTRTVFLFPDRPAEVIKADPGVKPCIRNSGEQNITQ